MNLQPQRKQRWFTAIPMTYQEGDAFWARDAGLYCNGFRQIGVESRFVALGEPCVREDVPLVLCSLAEMESADWWKQWQLDGLVLYAASPRYERIARAVKACGAKLVLQADTDGVASPSVWFGRYFRVKYVYAKRVGQPFPAFIALLKTLIATRKSYSADVIKHLEQSDVIAIQSPLGKQRYTRFLASCKRPDLIQKLVVNYHPVTSDMIFDDTMSKQPILIAVGRWDDYLKGAPLLIQVLAAVLAREADHTARIIGAGGAILQKLVARLPNPIQARIQILGRIGHDQLSRHYQQSQILVNSSHSESFNIAAAEALCCGCSVVGYVQISAMVNFCSANSGTLACDLSVGNYQDAVFTEIDAWKLHWRDPVKISGHWREKLAAPKVAERMLQLVS